MRLVPRLAAAAAVVSLGLTGVAAVPAAGHPATAAAPAAVARLAADPDLEIPGFDREAFADPTTQKPAVLWFWNRIQTEAQVDQTLQDMHDAGFTETVIFRMDAEPFFSPAWFARVEQVLEKSQELGMKVWLDNDSQFPSGAAGGLIVNGGTVGDKVYEPRPDLGVKTAVRTGNVVVRGGTEVDLEGLFGSSIQIEGGEVVADATVFPGITLLKQGAAWSDYSVEADFSVEAGTAGFMVRSPDKRNGYLVDVRKNGVVDFWKQVDGSFSQLRLGSGSPAGWNPEGRHTIRIRAVGDQLSATLDGMEVAPVTDSTFPTGRVGMRVDGPQKWRLADLEVTPAAGGEPLYSNDFSDQASVNDFDVTVTPLENVIAVTARPLTGPASTDLDQVVDLTDEAAGDGTWAAPAGDWRVEAFTYRFRGDNYADTLDAEAMALYDDIVMGEYYERFPWAFGTVLQGFADDEPSLSDRPNENAVPWTPTLADRVQDSGTTVARAMVSVFNDMGRAGATAKGRFYRAASDQWVETYWKPKFEWTEAHDVSIISNPLWDEHGPLEELRHSGNLLTAHQWSQIPGTDLIFNDVGNGAARFLPRTAASVAHQMGKPLVYDELMGATGWEKSLDDLREGAAISALRGVNKALFHTTYDAIEGIPYPPVFMEENTWWPWMDDVNTWTGRLMELGRHTTAAPTALLQMQRSNEAAQRSSVGFRPDQDWVATMNALEDSQVDFDQLDEGALTADPQVLTPASVVDGTLRVGDMTYTTVVVPRAPFVSLEAATTLRDLVASGGEVVFAGAAPLQEVDGRDDELAAVVAEIRSLGGDRVVTVDGPAQAGRAASGLGQAAVRLSTPDPGVRVLRFEEEGTDGYLLLNEGGAPVTTDVTFPADGVPALWNPETGDVTQATTFRATADGTVVPMTLEPRAPVMVTVSGEPGAHVTKVVGPAEVTSAEVVDGALTAQVRTRRSGTTSLRGDDGAGGMLTGTTPSVSVPDALALDQDWTMALQNGAPPVTRPLAGWTDVAPRYSGSATYTTQVTLDAAQVADADWTLDLGRVADVAEISVNGEHVADRIWAPYRLDLGEVLHEGANTIEVRVTNTQGNEKNQQAYDSGLYGPVRLVPSVTVAVVLAPTGVSAGTATATAVGDDAEVRLTVHNTGRTAVTGVVTATGPAGWTSRSSAPVTVPPGGSATGVALLVPGGFEPDGDVAVEAAFVVGGTVLDGTTTTLAWSVGTPPTGATDHVDLGDAASESAHGLTASPTSGTNVEAGLTRRYGGYRVPDAWYEFDLRVAAGKGFVLQGLETYDDNPQQKSYRVLVDGRLVATRLNVRPVRQQGTVAYRLHVPASFVTGDTVRVRLQSRSDPDFADPSLADVWALPPDTLTSVAAPRVTGTPQVGAVLRATAGSWSTTGLELAYQWLRAGAPVAGATGSSYRPGVADVGRRLSVRVTASKPGRPSAAATSAATGAVVKARSTTRLTVRKARVPRRKPVLLTVGVVSSPAATGKVVVRVDGRVVRRVTLRAAGGRVLLRLPRGRHRVTAAYAGSPAVAGSTSRVLRVTVT
ncbi:glycosylhydrolase-like jelly roll fold domain-containing protein [Nocardioides sp. 503]|uniref:glycosylhydrolase-like jelly roll fold domain-containing protein n=1 Tax=Nocardioides sp. 503 TaxID=2508326 RepID=UPI0010701128|nr:glycosylhydrolase-like jelly roll fold domain-containing protein [Nocardioides sp. 503]